MHLNGMDRFKEYLESLISPRQIRALLWKDLLVRWRQPWLVALQLIWPVLLFLSMYLLRLRFSSEEIGPCQFPTRQLPSKYHVLPFFQSNICSADNECIDPTTYEETSTFRDAPVTPVLHIVQTFLNEPALFDAIVTLPESGNFMGAMTTIATHHKFKYIEGEINVIRDQLPEIMRKVGNAFDIEKVWSDDNTFGQFGSILCGKPFPHSDNIRMVEKVFYREDYNGPDKSELDAMPTPYCKQLYLDVTRTSHGKVTWNHVKPIIQGKVVYGPDTPQTRQVMSFANGTFEGIDRLTTFIDSLDAIVTKLRTEDDFREKLKGLIALIKSPLIQSIIGSMSIDTAMIDGIFNSLVSDPGLSSILRTVSSIMGCFSVDRFQAVSDVQEFEKVAQEMSENKLFFAGIYFDNDGNLTQSKNVSFTIRMDIDNTPVTIESRNRFWFPGPEASFSSDMRYHRGFIDWQHIVESGIIKMFKTEKLERLGLAKDGHKLAPIRDEIDDLDDDDDDEFYNPFTASPTSLSIEFGSARNATTESSPPFDDDVESFLAFDDEPKKKTRKRRQLEGLLGSLFGGRSDTEEEEIEYDIDQVEVFTKMFPYPRYVKDDFKKGLYMANAVQIAFFFALLVQIASALRHRLWMKESGNRRLMQTMGLYNSSDIIAWSITTMIEVAITFFLCSVVLYGGGILMTTSKWFLTFFLLLFAVSTLAFCYMSSTFFSSASIGSVSAAIIFLMTFMPYVIIISLGNTLQFGWKFIMNLSITTAFCYAWHHVTRMELQQAPLTFDVAFAGPLQENDVKFGMFMLALDAVLYVMVGFLYEHFFADEHKFFEVRVKDMDASIGALMANVTKSYGAVRPALHKVSITFRRDFITCLLGRNGAGKSTIINLLTGQIEATSGQIYLPQNVNAITGDEHKERVGLCPQGNVLIPNLTAKEHLQLYAQIKMRSDGQAEVEKVMRGLDFGQHENFASENLSGGFKRRLNIGIAFIGSPNLVILDEPCSAIDTKARKAIWDTIKTLRKGRAVIMATHYLDEAEHLSDNVIIMNEGKLIGEHRPDSLKEQFTKSFLIKIELVDTPMQRTTIEDIRNRFAEHAPHHTIDDMQSNVVDITVPYKTPDGNTTNFGPLIRTLEELQRTKLIVDFKVQSNDLEGIFNRLIQSQDACGDEAGNDRSDVCNGNSVPPSQTQYLSQWTVMRILFWKRFLHFKRNFRMLICMLVLPTAFVAIAMGFMTIRPPGDFDNALPLSTGLYAGSEEFNSLDRGTPFDQQVFDEVVTPGSRGFNTSEDIFRWLLAYEGANATNRYGGISLNNSIVAVWYNNKGYHSMPAYLNRLNNAMFNVEMNTTGAMDERYHIRTVNHPIKLGMAELSISSVLQRIADAGISIILLMSFSLVIAGSSVYIVSERVSGEKLQQKIAGVLFPTYWGVSFAWDMAVYLVAMVLAVAVILIFEIPAFTAKDNLAGNCVLLLMYGFATIPMVHLAEKLFNDASLANMYILCMNIILGFTTRSVVFLIDVLGESETSEAIHDFLNRLFLIFPQHALSDGMVAIFENHILAEVFERYFIDTYKSPLTSNLLLPHLLSLFVFGLVFIVANYAIESGLVYRLWHRINRRLRGERREFLNIVPLATSSSDLSLIEKDHQGDVVHVTNLCKTYYGKHKAVDDVSFRVRRGECFGLLGANGAGKSTIFSILSGQKYQTSGTVQWFNRLGVSYCPQANALDMLLTVYETIRFYGTLRRIEDLDKLTARTLRQFHLTQYSDVLVKNLSGGNRRKLSVACTCFGQTSLVLMDEPTSDMDPITRALTYACIRTLLVEKRSVILTSHTITEIDRVCDRIGVLRAGKMIALGTPGNLQTSYGNSYMVTVFYDQSQDRAALERDLMAQFADMQSLMVHSHCVQFTMPILPVCADESSNGRLMRGNRTQGISLSSLFDQIHSFTTNRSLVYTITQSLLDKVFEQIIDNYEPDESMFTNSAFVLNETAT